jgi:hypothetical protein
LFDEVDQSARQLGLSLEVHDRRGKRLFVNAGCDRGIVISAVAIRTPCNARIESTVLESATFPAQVLTAVEKTCQRPAPRAGNAIAIRFDEAAAN